MNFANGYRVIRTHLSFIIRFFLRGDIRTSTGSLDPGRSHDGAESPDSPYEGEITWLKIRSSEQRRYYFSTYSNRAGMLNQRPLDAPSAIRQENDCPITQASLLKAANIEAQYKEQEH
jgi:hypothetical protein